jgi:ribonucleotide reductase beta subunit family protein with ferritin-like domain
MHPLLVDRGIDLLPIEPGYECIEELTQKLKSTEWTAEEMQLDQNKSAWDRLDEDIRKYIKMTFAFFIVGDKDVGLGAAELAHFVKHPVYSSFYKTKAYNEDTHERAYITMPLVFVTDAEERALIFDMARNHEVIKNKRDFVNQLPLTEDNFVRCSLILAITEWIFFASSFALFYWLGSKREYSAVLNRLIDVNKWVATEEGIHSMCEIYKYTKHTPFEFKVNPEWIRTKIHEACELEIAFAKVCLGDGFVGINIDSMSDYIKFLGNQLCVHLECNKLYTNVHECPLPYMKNMRLETKGDIHTNSSAGNYNLNPSMGDEEFIEPS